MRAIHTATVLSLAILARRPLTGTKTEKDKSYEGDWEGLPKFTPAKSQLVIDLAQRLVAASVSNWFNLS